MILRRMNMIAFAALASAASLDAVEPANPAPVESYPVEGRVRLPRDAALPTTEVTLNGGEHRALTRPDGRFTFHDVPPGVYLLDVLSLDYVFSQIKLNLPATAGEQPRCLEYVYPGAAKKPHPYPVELTPHLKAQYFEERESPGLHTLFANPMLLMMLFTGGLVMFMPKLMDGLDPEEKKKLEEQMGSAGDPTALLKNMFGMPSGDADDSDDDEPKQKSIKRK
mmetsp:Transcript_23375/g.70138  ORF Transcript_23375/g.70138 Transcript_23375/m.70138 type:complete len:223 (-) Transcript_23375:41-709(-)